MSARALLSPFEFIWKRGIRPAFQWLDASLVKLAGLFGAFEPDVRRRALWMNGIFLGIYLLGALPIPVVSLVALFVGYGAVLAVGRAWVANEKVRTNIVKKLDETDPNTLPDLRAAALLCALHLLILFPLLLWQLDVHFPGSLFKMERAPNFLDWLEFAFEPYAKPVFDLLQGGGSAQDILPASAAGRYIVLLKRLTLDFILIQGVVRLFAIQTTIREGVAALKLHPDVTIRLGRRAIGPLGAILRDPAAVPELKANAVLVLGQLKSARSVPDLVTALGDPSPEVRWRAATALGEIADPSSNAPLLQAVRDTDPNTARAALDALVAVRATEIVPTLREWLAGTGPAESRSLAVEGLRQLAGKDSVEPLLAALRDPAEDVAKTAAASLGQLRDERAIEPLGCLVMDGDSPKWLRYEAAKALEAIGSPASVSPLQAALTDPDPSLRRLAVRALGTLRDPSTSPALIAALKDEAPDVREAAAQAVGALKATGGHRDLLKLLDDPHAEVRTAAADSLVWYEAAAVTILEQALCDAEGDRRARIQDVLQRLQEPKK